MYSINSRIPRYYRQRVFLCAKAATAFSAS